MTQLQVYSNKLSFYYLFGYFVIVAVKIALVGVIFFYIFQQIQKRVKNFIDKFNLLEDNLREVNKKYDILLSELIVRKEEYKNLSNNQELRTLELFSSLENKLIQMNENNNKNNELIELKFSESTAIMESELYKLNSQINNDYVLIGYKFIGMKNSVIPIVESVNTFTMFEGSILVYDCFIVSQLKYFKNIKEINIMSVVDKMFLFNGIPLSELYLNNSGHSGQNNSMLNCERMAKENKPNYFVVIRGLFCYINGGSSLALFRESYEIKMYVKNGVKKLYNELKKININLTMPDDLWDFVFK